MRAVDLIRKKRDGGEHSQEEIAWLVESFTRGGVADYQMASWMMAVVWRGMTEKETAALTGAMLQSGQVMDFSAIPGAKVDKHSTGGVGDKTSLILAPLVACGGLNVPMISGRGLGHTGGTLDKLESIKGFDVNLPTAEFNRVLKTCGCAMVGQTADVAPADKKMYALRDVTGTVESPPLICASIMSKKLAEGIDALVLDVKTGSGAFMKKPVQAVALAQLMVDTGERMGKRMVALITDMDQPLGRTVGNGLEVRECLEIMRGDRHPMSEALRALTLELAAWMFYLGERAPSVEAGKKLSEELLTSGQALKKFCQMCQEQGADKSFDGNPNHGPRAKETKEFCAHASGFITAIDCEKVGIASQVLGGGRSRQEDSIDPLVGLELHRAVGDAVEAGESIATVHINDQKTWPMALELLQQAYRIEAQPLQKQRPLIHQIIAGTKPKS